MPHILIGGDLKNGSLVRPLLRKWGMTWNLWSPSDTEPGLPTLDQGVALILLISGEEFPVSVADHSAGVPHLPLILLGDNPGCVLQSRDAQRVINDPGPHGVDLKFALQSCLDQTRQMRGQVEQDPAGDQVGYLHFLGHELRSPLTAAKTALEVLQGELGGLAGGHPDQEMGQDELPSLDPRLKMLDIALRNIKRLHRTVDWSQDLLELEAAAPRGQWTRFPVEKMLEGVVQLSSLVVQDEVRGRCLESDSGLLKVLVGQMIRVLEYALPGCPVQGEVRLDSTRPRGLELILHPQNAHDVLAGPRIVRTHLAPAGSPQECSSEEELGRLAEFVVSQPLLDQLQAEVAVLALADSTPGLVLRLILTADDSQGDSVPRTHPPLLRAPA